MDQKKEFSVDRRRIEVVDPITAKVLRDRTTAQRILMMLDANGTARLLVASGVRNQHPALSEVEVNRETVKRMLHAASNSG